MALLKITEIFAYVQEMCSDQIIGKKSNRRISKWWLKENEAHQVFQKTIIFYHLIRTRTK